MKARLLILIAVAVLVASTSPHPTFAQAVIDDSPILTIDTGVDGVEAQLVRNGNALAVSATFHGVRPRETFTLWWIIIEGEDVLVLNATGGISNRHGELRLAAGLPTGSYDGGPSESRQVLVPGALTDPYGALIIMDLVGHGPPIPGMIPDQISRIEIDPVLDASITFLP